MSEIKQLMKEVDIGLANRVMALVYEIYLDGQYRERTNMQMHDRIINLESRLASMEELPLSRRGAMDSGRVAGGVKMDGGMGVNKEWVEYQQA